MEQDYNFHMQLKTTRHLLAVHGYKTVAKQLTSVSWVTLPNIKQLDDGNGTKATMMRYHAGWHKTCHLKFNLTKLSKCIILTFDEDIGSALRKVCNIDDMQCTRHVLHK